MLYCIDSRSCPFCDSPSKLASKNRNISKLQCPKCKFENDLANVACVACDFNFDEEEKKVACEHCGMLILKCIF